MNVSISNETEDAKSLHRKNLGFLAACSLFTALVFTMPLLVPGLRTWGTDYVSFLPLWLRIVIIGALISTLTSIFSSRSRIMYEAISCYLEELDDSKRSKITVLVVLLLGSVFILFHVRTNFLGDGYQWVANFGSADSPYLRSIKSTVLGSSYLVRGIQSLLGEFSAHSARFAFQILSYISGIIVVRNIMSISKLLYPDYARQFYFFCATTITPLLLLFFGYVEFYPVLWAGLSFFLLYSVRAINGKSPAWLAICFLLLASLLHLSALFYGLGLLAVLVSKERCLTFIRKHRVFLASAISAVLIAGIIVLENFYSGNIAFRDIFLRPFDGKPIAREYGIFTAPHFIDIFNLLLISSPAVAIWIAIAGVPKGIWSNHVNRFLLSCGCGGVLFLMIVDPKLGFPRDWDLMSFTLFPLNMLLVKQGLDNVSRWWRGTAIPMILISALMTTAFVIVNVNEESSVKRFEHLLNLDARKSRTGWYIWSKYQKKKGEYEIARYADFKVDSLFPEQRIADLAYRHINQGRLDRAWDATQICLRADSFAVEANLLAARYYHIVGMRDSAAAFFKRTFQLVSTAQMAFIYKAEFLSDNSKMSEAVNLLKKGLYLHPRNKRMNRMLGEYLLSLGRFDEAEHFGNTLLRLNRESAAGYLILLYVAESRSDFDNAPKYYRFFLRFGVEREDYESIRAKFSYLIN